jgi:hypothetical protein
MGVRYLVLPRRAAPGSTGAVTTPPVDVTMALQDQLDLRQVPSDPSILLYENVAWAPSRAIVPPGAVDATRSPRPESAGSVELAGADPALQKVRGPQSFSGPLSAGNEVLFAESATSRWTLAAGGQKLTRHVAFGWANSYTASAEGTGTLHYRTPASRYVGLAIEALLWLLVIRTVVMQRHRRRVVPDATPTGTDGDVLTPGPDDDMDDGGVGAAVSVGTGAVS